MVILEIHSPIVVVAGQYLVQSYSTVKADKSNTNDNNKIGSVG